jgi:hypothetical protein
VSGCVGEVGHLGAALRQVLLDLGVGGADVVCGGGAQSLERGVEVPLGYGEAAELGVGSVRPGDAELADLEVSGVAGDDQVPVRSVDRPRPCSHANYAVQADKVFRVWLHADPEAFLDHGEPEVAPLR